MIPFEVLVIGPTLLAGDCLDALRTRLGESDRTLDDVLSLTFFSSATERSSYSREQDEVLALVRDAFGTSPPAVSLVAQAPLGGGAVALEASVLRSSTPDTRVHRKTCDGLPYTLVTGAGVRQIHAGGISSSGEPGETAAQARCAFERMEAILRREQMTFGNVVRQWNYIEDVLEVRSNGSRGQQAYQVFNDVRTLAYGDSEFAFGYPAATGIGQVTGGVLIEFVALDAPAEVRVASLSNPRQTDAHHYSARQLVGESLDDLPVKSTPKFERAKLIARDRQEIIFLSGTAAILGERSVAPGDAAAQTRTTIDIITALIGDRGFTHLRTYVKRPEELQVVRSQFEAAYGPIPALYVRADICRDELLMEVEGVLIGDGPADSRGAAPAKETR